jgi:predicted RNA-binding Zn-ribbon protein involved in translation (DUF1610 family)
MYPIINEMKELSFDSSLSSIDATLSDNEYREHLVSLLKQILEQRFPGNYGKQQIRVHKDRINFACPACGDSMHNDYKKRGNFILIGKFTNFFKCHNCGEFKRIDQFFHDYKIDIDLKIINYIAKGITDFGTHADTKYDMSLFLDMESVDNYAIDRQEFLQYFNLIEAKESPVWPWLTNRMQYNASKFMYNARLNHVIILNLTHSGKILGIQKRTFKGENKYLTGTLERIYELMKKNTKEIPNEISTLSQLFNICLVDYTKPITLFEGPFDSYLFNNSVANAGAHKAFPLDIQLRYWYDDDKDGRKKSIEKINAGEEVFLWTKLKKELELPTRKKWDLTDVLIYLRDKNIRTPNFNKYFSNNELDIIDI